ncbi:MAG: RNA methyltransferase [Acidobacteria bacterium]|nr:RNA methyltransferase [Acidobacteriota bacterium]
MTLALPSITSRRHPLVQACRDARGGGPDEPLLLDGWHLLVDAVAAGLAVDAVAVNADPPGAAEARALDALIDGGAHVVHVTDDILQAISPVRTSSGVVALARRPVLVLDAVFAPGPALVVVGVDVQDPGNVGALVRTAEAAGATGFVAAGVSADPLGWKALRASMGSAFRLPLGRTADTTAFVTEARGRGLRIVALAPRGGRVPDAVDLRAGSCLLVGGEGPGLSSALLSGADDVLTLPMAAPVESLNVAVAGALVVYAAAAQRRARA